MTDPANWNSLDDATVRPDPEMMGRAFVDVPEQASQIIAAMLSGTRQDFQTIARDLGLADSALAKAIARRLLARSVQASDFTELLRAFDWGERTFLGNLVAGDGHELVRGVVRVSPLLFDKYKAWASFRARHTYTLSGKRGLYAALGYGYGYNYSPLKPIAQKYKIIANRYDLMEILGQGGQAVVWKARDKVLKRVVALKSFSERQNSRVARSEIELLQCFQSRRILSVLDFGRHGDEIFVVTPLYCGDASRLAKAQASPSRVARLIRDVAEAVAELHQAGIVHRDIKPSNVLLTRSGKPVLSDLGLSLYEKDSGSARFAGTPYYMSPEQFCNQPVDRRTDVYSLGVTLYQLLTGRLPFRTEEIEKQDQLSDLRRRVIHDDPPAMSTADRQIPAGLEAICRRAMSKDPAARFQGAGEMASALRNEIGIWSSFANSIVDLLSFWRRSQTRTGISRANIGIHRRNLEESIGIGDLSSQGEAHLRLAQALTAARNRDEALSHFDAAAAIYRDLGDKAQHAETLWAMSRTLDNFGDRDKAVEVAREALNLFEQSTDPAAEMVRIQLEVWGVK